MNKPQTSWLKPLIACFAAIAATATAIGLLRDSSISFVRIDELIANGNANKAIEALGTRLSRDRNDHEAAYRLGRLLIARGRPNDALRLLEQIPMSHERGADALLDRGDVTLFVLHDTVEAERLVKQAIELNPDDYRYWSWLVDLYIVQRRFNDWRNAAEQFVTLHGEVDPAFLYQMTVGAKFDEQRGIDMLSQYVAARPDDIHSLIGLVENLWDLGEHDNATSQFRKSLLIEPDHHRVLRFELQLHHESGAFDAADNVIHRAEKLPELSRDRYFLQQKGHVDLDQGRIRDAIATFQKAVEYSPLSHAAFQGLGRALLLAQSQEEGSRQLEIARHLEQARQRAAAIESRQQFTRDDCEAMSEIAQTLALPSLAERWRKVARRRPAQEDSN